MPRTHLAEQFERIIADAASIAAFRDHLSSDFTYARWGAGCCLGFWQRVSLWEHQDSTRAEFVGPSGNFEINEIYVDAERAAVIGCMRFIHKAGPCEARHAMHGVGIAHFNAEGRISRLDDYSDIGFFDGHLPSSAGW